MTATACKLCHAPLSTCACVTDEHLAARFAAMRQPPLREFLGARERIRVRQFPDVVAGEQTEWSALAIEAIGDTPAARAATHLDHQRWVRQQLSLRPSADAAMTEAVRERLFPGLPRGAAERDARSGLNAQIFNLAGELLLWREVCGDLVAADDEARRTWLTEQVRLAEVYRHNLEAVASMLAEGRAYGGGPDDAAGYLAEVLGQQARPGFPDADAERDCAGCGAPPGIRCAKDCPSPHAWYDGDDEEDGE